MALAEEALYSRITTDPALALLGSPKLFPITMPQDERYGITYRRLTTGRLRAMVVDPGIQGAQFEIEVWAEEYNTVATIVTILRRRLQNWRGLEPVNFLTILDTSMDDEQHDFEPNSKLFTARLDIILIVREGQIDGFLGLDAGTGRFRITSFVSRTAFLEIVGGRYRITDTTNDVRFIVVGTRRRIVDKDG